MCGRFSLTTPEELIAEVFALDERPRLEPRYNIAPSQEIAVIVQPEGKRRLELQRWGMLAPGDAERDDALLINARAETLATKPLFRESLRERRCLVPADGFYEWRKAGSRREPFHIRLRDRRPFAFAGLWREEADGEARRARACVIVTTEPNAVTSEIHDRMPAILAPASYDAWLSRAPTPPAALLPLLRPYPEAEMEAVRVSSYVNGAAAEGPRCLEPERQGSLFF
jgi:putative SOS response-associated peptidase YedK